jgi:hypothetical protein
MSRKTVDLPQPEGPRNRDELPGRGTVLHEKGHVVDDRERSEGLAHGAEFDDRRACLRVAHHSSTSR